MRARDKIRRFSALPQATSDRVELRTVAACAHTTKTGETREKDCDAGFGAQFDTYRRIALLVLAILLILFVHPVDEWRFERIENRAGEKGENCALWFFDFFFFVSPETSIRAAMIRV